MHEKSYSFTPYSEKKWCSPEFVQIYLALVTISNKYREERNKAYLGHWKKDKKYSLYQAEAMGHQPEGSTQPPGLTLSPLLILFCKQHYDLERGKGQKVPPWTTETLDIGRPEFVPWHLHPLAVWLWASFEPLWAPVSSHQNGSWDITSSLVLL